MPSGWTVFESSRLLNLYRTVAPQWVDETWIDTDGFLEILLGPSPDPVSERFGSVPASWKQTLLDLRWAGMIEPSHVDFACDALGNTLRLRRFFRWAKEVISLPDTSDRAFRTALAIDAIRRSQTQIELPPLRLVRHLQSRSLFSDLADALSLTETQVTTIRADELGPVREEGSKPKRFLFTGPTVVRLRDLVSRWLRNPEHRVAVFVEGPQLMQTRLHIALSKMKDPIVGHPADLLSDRWMRAVRSEPHWPALRRFELAECLSDVRHEIDAMACDPERLRSILLRSHASEDEQNTLLAVPTDATHHLATVPKRDGRISFWTGLMAAALPSTTLTIVTCAEGSVPDDSVFSDRECGVLAQAGFEISPRHKTPEQLSTELDQVEKASNRRLIVLTERRFGAHPVLRTPLFREAPERPVVSMPKSTRRMLSASQCEVYVSCPAKYFYRYVLGLQTIPKAFARLPMLFGQLVHSVLEEHFRDQAGAVLDGREIERVSQPHLDLLEATPAEKHLLALQLQKVLSAVPAIETDLASLYPRAHKPVLFEHAFEFEFHKTLFKGRIDRVDQLDDGSVVLIDYKTGATGFSPEHVLKGNHFQALVYLMAAEKVLQKPVAGVLFYDLRQSEVRRGLVRTEALAPGATKKLTRGHALTSDRYDAVVEQGVAHLRTVCDAIASGDFAPQPSAQNCSQCDFAQHCRHAYHWRDACRG